MAQLITFEGQQTLWKYLEEERPDKELLDVAADLCVWDIHRKGIIHLDLKEDSVLVDARGRVHLIEKGRLYGLKSEEGSSSPCLAPEMFTVHRSSPAQDAYSVGYLLSLIFMEMDFSEDVGRIALGYLKTDPPAGSDGRQQSRRV